MFTPDVRFEGFSPEQWEILGRLFRGRRDVAAPSRSSGLIAVTQGSELVKLVSTERGRMDPKGRLWPVDLSILAGLHGAGWALRFSTGALEEFSDRFAVRLTPEHDLLGQALLLFEVLRELEGEGVLEVWPWKIEHWPVPSARVVTRALDAACGLGKVLLLGVFGRGEVLTTVALRRGEGGFDWVAGPGVLLPEAGLLSGDWRRDYRYVAEVAERRVGPLATGCFGEFDTLQTLMTEAEPGAWAAAVAARDVVLAPVSAALAVPLGLDAGRAALFALRGLALRLGADTWLRPGGALFGALERASELEPLLGFDPVRLLGRVLGREPQYRRLGSKEKEPRE